MTLPPRCVLRALLMLALACASATAQQAVAPPGSSNSQQPEPLPINPLRPGEKPETPVLPDEIKLLPGEIPLFRTPEEKPRELPRYKLQLAVDAMQPVLPPLDERLAAAALANSVKVSVKKFAFEGNHVFSDRQLAQIVASYAGRVITSEELEEARVALTKHYVDAGYITSGALLPDQDPSGGVIKFQIVEGHLTEIELRGNFWYRGWWLRNQMRRAAGWPVNFNNLKTGLQLLRQNPTISRVNAELKPGVKQGESILEVAVKDEQPFRFGFEISNRRPPSVSEGIGELYLTDLNLSGHNDPLDLRWGLVRWTKEGAIDYAEFDNVSGSYELPVTPWDTTLQVYASKTDSSIIDETFAALGITSRSEEFGLTLKQPLYKTLNNTVTASLGADRKHSETYLLGRPFTLSLGALDGEADTFATRLALEWVNRSQVHVLALRSQFSLGLYAFDSTRADPRTAGGTTSGTGSGMGFDPEIPDSKFFAWLGQAQYVRRIFDTELLRKKPDTIAWNTLRETLLVLRANAQLSDEPLLSLEQFSIGGMQSVRGYRENQLLRDNGVFASVELRIPIWLTKDKTPLVSLAPFFDFGGGWNVNKVDDNYQTIYSAGLGLLVNATKHAQATIYWGHPFVDFYEKNVSLQDYGLHFAVSINAF
ncbi:MAG: ShlB/FhaC/HecB family hemolysin secretion/activation protein [Chthoniobacteraceae bacterium]